MRIGELGAVPVMNYAKYFSALSAPSLPQMSLSFQPALVQILASLNPLHHCVVLVRNAVFGFDGWEDLLRLGVLVLFGLLVWRIAIVGMTRKLID